MTIKQTALEVWKLANSRDHNDPLFIAAIAALRREREPVAWRVRERPGFNWHFIDGDPDRDPTLRGHERQPLYATPPDALALVAATYRDAAGVCETRLIDASYENDWAQGWCAGVSGTEDDILARTPADATAALAAIERAAYERGAEAGWSAARTSVYSICEDIEDRASSDLERPQASEYGTGYLEAEKSTAKSIRRAMGSFEARDDDNFVALLTQEGR